MQQNRKLLVGILIIILVIVLFPRGSIGSPVPLFSTTEELEVSTDAGLQLISSNNDGLTFRLSVPWEQLTLSQEYFDGRVYTRVSIPGWDSIAQPGAPELPFWSTTIGIPFDAEVTVESKSGNSHTIPLATSVLPVAIQEVDQDIPDTLEGLPDITDMIYMIEADPAIYQSDSVYPESLAEATNVGMLRQQRVAGIAAYPLQYNPLKNELTIYETLIVRVEFAPSASRQQLNVNEPENAKTSGQYEDFYRQTLLNHDIAKAWRQPLTSFKKQQAENITTIPWESPDPGWRVKIGEEGFYKLTYTETLSANLPVATLNPKNFKLYYMGEEVAIEVFGEGDQNFGEDDYIVFYGQTVDSKYTLDNVYWLTYGDDPGLRFSTIDGTPNGGTIPDYYPAQLHMEENSYYQKSVPGDDELERWLWAPLLTNGTEVFWSHTISLIEPYSETYSATLKIEMVGITSNPAIDPDHHAIISINNTQVADVTWDGKTWKTVEVDFDHNLLHAGENTLKVTAPNDTGAGSEFFFIDRVELRYANKFNAESDVLTFYSETNGTWQFQVDGFSTDQLVVYDITNPAAVAKFQNIEILGSDPYSAIFQDLLDAPARFWTMANTAYKTVHAIEEDSASNLRSTANAAEHLVITHKDFLTQAEQLRDFRASQGLSAMAVDVQDVYDEFGYGIEGVIPIHDFLAYAYGQWLEAPTFVVLIGDGHYDPKNYLGYGKESYIPPYLAYADPWPGGGEVAADNRYVTVSGEDLLPDMMLGRLAVNSLTEASNFVNKIIAYEENPVAGDWTQQVLAITDNVGTNDPNFYDLSDALLNCCLPLPYQSNKVYYGVTHTDLSAARTAILNQINAGTLIVNYIGHAGTNAWAGEGLFINTDVAGLTNGGKFPVMLPMSCMEGNYINPHLTIDRYSMAEVVTRAENQGAVASWSPTGLGTATGHEYLNKGFFNAIFSDGLTSLGQATVAGKLNLWASGDNLDLIDTYLLFGDPAMNMALLSPAAPTTLLAQAISTTQIDLTWEDNSSETEFRLERSPDGVSDWQVIAIVDGNVTNYSDTGLTCGTTFFYRVRAYREGDDQYSDYSNISSATTLDCILLYFPMIHSGEGS